MNIIITFHTTYDNLKAEEFLTGKGISIKVKPLPRHLGSECGLVIEGKLEDKNIIEETLRLNEVEYENIHIIE